MKLGQSDKIEMEKMEHFTQESDSMFLCCVGMLCRPFQNPLNPPKCLRFSFLFQCNQGGLKKKKKVNNFLWEKVLHLPAPTPFETKEFKTQIFQVYVETHHLSQNSAQGQPYLLSIYMFSLYSSLDRIYPGTKVSLSSTHFFF